MKCKPHTCATKFVLTGMFACIILIKEFPQGAIGTSVKKRNLTLSAYPNFQTTGLNIELGYLAYADKFVGDMEKSLGR